MPRTTELDFGDWRPPPPPRTLRARLEVLDAGHAALDHDAIMGSRARLRRELRWGSDPVWPPDGFTLAENAADLAEHRAEFDRGERFAYTVLDPAGARCLGCVYLERAADDALRLALWVIDDEVETGLEGHLLDTLIGWFVRAWPFDRLVVALRDSNPRGIPLLAARGFAPAPDGLPGHRSFVRDLSRA